MAAAFSACGHRASTATDANADSVSIDSTKVDSVVAETKRALAIDTINIERSDSMAEVSMTIQWPTGGDEVLVKSVRAFICDVCGIKDKAFKGTKADFKDIVDTEYNGLVESWNGTYNGESGPSFTSATEVVQLAETPTFVTFYGESSSYTGGAHGMAVHVGRSFRKSDGKAIGYETDMDDHFNVEHKDDNLFANTESPALYKLIKAGVHSYFKACGQPMADDAELADFLQVDNVNRIPLPGNAPYWTKTGIVFCYTQYEIAPYAAGMITFEIPYDRIREFLTDEAASLIP
jgi:hypothetical protein